MSDFIHILAQADAAPAAPAATTAAPAAPAEGQAVTTQPASQPPAEAQQQEGGGMSMLVSLLLIGVIFYFLLIRPQRKQQKEQKERQDSLKAGDKVVTIGGIYGTIREVMDDAVKVEVASGVTVKFAKAAIAQNLAEKSAKTDKK